MQIAKPLTLSVGPRYTSPLFRFPGSFHPPLVSSLIEAHPRATVVGDPMVGSGTTAVMAVAMGRKAIVNDIDPLSCLITRAKTSPVNPNRLESLVEDVISAVGPIGYRACVPITPANALRSMESVTPFRIPINVYHWFHPTVARDIARCLMEVHRMRGSLRAAEWDAVLAIVAATIRRVSKADPRTVSGLEVTSVWRGKLAKGLRFNLAAQLRDRTMVLVQGYRDMQRIKGLGKAHIMNGSALQWYDLCINAGALPQLQITSPPYMSAIEYARRHKLENQWLGLVAPENYAEFSRKFFGAKYRISATHSCEAVPPEAVSAVVRRLTGQRRAGAEVEQYFLDALAWLGELRRVAAETGPISNTYIVVGPSTTQGQVIDTPELIAIIAKRVGFTVVSARTHGIINQRMQYPTKNGVRIRTETVLRMKPDKGVPN